MRRFLRQDPLTGHRAIIAPERIRRAGASPADFHIEPDSCPFCPGHEDATKPTLDARPTLSDWVVRVFPNRFPALMVERDPAGAHEVIVETPVHYVPVWRAPVDHHRASLILARDRMRDLSGDHRFQAFVWFRNHGPLSGASQPHAHAQLLALPYVPVHLDEMVRRCAGFDFGRIIDEAEGEERLVSRRGDVLAFCPPAPRAPFEVWVAPLDNQADFRDASDLRLADLADLCSQVLCAIEEELGEISIVASLVTRPAHRDAPGLRWHLRLEPRLEIPSGFHAATGDAIVGVAPEVAASLLREAMNPI